MENYPKYALVRGTVSGRQQYGLLVALESGDRGFVDTTYLTDPAVSVQSGNDVPETGGTVEAVVLGTTNDGRIRLSTRATDLALARSASDLGGTFDAWERCRNADRLGAAEAASFLALPDSDAVLSWALRQSPRSSDLELALRILAASPTEVRTRHEQELSHLATNGVHADVVRQLLAGDSNP